MTIVIFCEVPHKFISKFVKGCEIKVFEFSAWNCVVVFCIQRIAPFLCMKLSLEYNFPKLMRGSFSGTNYVNAPVRISDCYPESDLVFVFPDAFKRSLQNA